MTSSRFVDLAFDLVSEREASSIEEKRRMKVQSWLVIRAPSSKFHLVALIDLGSGLRTVCVSSAIAAVDRDGRVVTTSSGRLYELTGPPEGRELERDVLHSGAVRLGMGEAVDVSVFAWDLLHFDSLDLRLL